MHVPRYFFHVADGEDYPDLQGTVLHNDAEARTEAVRFSGQLLSDQPDKFWSGEEWKMRVTDHNDLTLFELMFTASCSAAMPMPKSQLR
jgi:hypothetical protein